MKIVFPFFQAFRQQYPISWHGGIRDRSDPGINPESDVIARIWASSWVPADMTKATIPPAMPPAIFPVEASRGGDAMSVVGWAATVAVAVSDTLSDDIVVLRLC